MFQTAHLSYIGSSADSAVWHFFEVVFLDLLANDTFQSGQFDAFPNLIDHYQEVTLKINKIEHDFYAEVAFWRKLVTFPAEILVASTDSFINLECRPNQHRLVGLNISEATGYTSFLSRS